MPVRSSRHRIPHSDHDNSGPKGAPGERMGFELAPRRLTGHGRSGRPAVRHTDCEAHCVRSRVRKGLFGFLENAERAGAAFDAIVRFKGPVLVGAGGHAAIELEREAIGLLFDVVDAGVDGIFIEAEVDLLPVGIGDRPLQCGLVGAVGDFESLCHCASAMCALARALLDPPNRDPGIQVPAMVFGSRRGLIYPSAAEEVLKQANGAKKPRAAAKSLTQFTERQTIPKSRCYLTFRSRPHCLTSSSRGLCCRPSSTRFDLLSCRRRGWQL